VPFRFVHAADIHLDSPLRSLALRDAELAELIGNATRRALVGIVELCLSERVDALLLAGDLYDGEQTSMKTARFLAEQFRLLHQAGIRVFKIRGNHDAMSRITKELTFGDSVKIFGGRADPVRIAGACGGTDVVVQGISFAQPQAPDSLLPKYRTPASDAINIGLMHTSLGGAPGHGDYAPCKMAELEDAGFDYWALGHIHKRSVVQTRCTIVMPGMPQGRDINEAGAKSVTLVTIADDRAVHIEERFTSIAQFERIPVDLTGIDDWSDMVGMLGGALGKMRDQVVSEHLVARLEFRGATPLAWRLRRDSDVLSTEAADRAFVTGKVWIEAVEVHCHAPVQRPGAPPDPLTELRTLIQQDILASDAFRREAAQIATELRLQLPSDARGFLGLDESSFDAALADIIRDGTEDVLARLHPQPVGEQDNAATHA
jgi:DNA repair protein SbcD/Mre11